MKEKKAWSEKFFNKSSFANSIKKALDLSGLSSEVNML